MALRRDTKASATDATDAWMRPSKGEAGRRRGRLGLPVMLTDLRTRPAETRRDDEVQAGTALRYPAMQRSGYTTHHTVCPL
jgi:hypothetical protein